MISESVAVVFGIMRVKENFARVFNTECWGRNMLRIIWNYNDNNEA
jgi:hypothetical protein